MDHQLPVGVFVYYSILVLSRDSVVLGRSIEVEDTPFSVNLESGSGSGDVVETLPESCTAEYRQESRHTMCLTDDDRVVFAGVGSIDVLEILEFHNYIRANVYPPAQDLTIMVWDDLLASVAEKWAKQCVLGHDKNRNIPSYGLFIGQNVAVGYENWIEALESWYSEVMMYQYGVDVEDYLGAPGWSLVGHYTQLVQNSTYRVGCGYARCENTPFHNFYVCNYARGQTRTSHPYTIGQNCQACPRSCRHGLCDCGGKLCLNGGQLDIDTCTCKCSEIYKGDNCSQLNCPVADAANCEVDFLASDCQLFENVPLQCPFMCGLCEGVEQGSGEEFEDIIESLTSSPVIAANLSSIFVSAFNCTYLGVRPSADECAGFGQYGMDTEFCSSRGGEFKCQDCLRDPSVSTYQCPVMCGACEAPCGGKTCMHEGRLDPRTCQCTCKPPFVGTTCDEIVCPQEDSQHCGILAPEHCPSYKNALVDCPFLCGLCA